MIKVLAQPKTDSFFTAGARIGFQVTPAFMLTDASGNWGSYGQFVVDVSFLPGASRSKIEAAILDAIVAFPGTRPDVFDPAVWGHFTEKDIISLISVSIG